MPAAGVVRLVSANLSRNTATGGLRLGRNCLRTGQSNLLQCPLVVRAPCPPSSRRSESTGCAKACRPPERIVGGERWKVCLLSLSEANGAKLSRPARAFWRELANGWELSPERSLQELLGAIRLTNSEQQPTNQLTNEQAKQLAELLKSFQADYREHIRSTGGQQQVPGQRTKVSPGLGRVCLARASTSGRRLGLGLGTVAWETDRFELRETGRPARRRRRHHLLEASSSLGETMAEAPGRAGRTNRTPVCCSHGDDGGGKSLATDEIEHRPLADCTPGAFHWPARICLASRLLQEGTKQRDNWSFNLSSLSAKQLRKPLLEMEPFRALGRSEGGLCDHLLLSPLLLRPNECLAGPRFIWPDGSWKWSSCCCNLLLFAGWSSRAVQPSSMPGGPTIGDSFDRWPAVPASDIGNGPSFPRGEGRSSRLLTQMSRPNHRPEAAAEPQRCSTGC